MNWEIREGQKADLCITGLKGYVRAQIVTALTGWINLDAKARKPRSRFRFSRKSFVEGKKHLTKREYLAAIEATDGMGYTHANDTLKQLVTYNKKVEVFHELGD